MFGLFRKKKADVFDHWYSLVPGFNTSTKGFYEAVKKELTERQVPGLIMSRVDFAEGGFLGSNREYLRMTRETLVFDVCAAPFGTAYFFSCRFGDSQSRIKLWHLLLVFGLMGAFIAIGFIFLNWLLMSAILVIGGGMLIQVLFSAATEMNALDGVLAKDPVIGPLYKRLFRKETYYREDTRIMYRDTVNAVVKELVEKTTGAHGIKLIKFNDYSPLLGELYKPTAVSLPKEKP